MQTSTTEFALDLYHSVLYTWCFTGDVWGDEMKVLIVGFQMCTEQGHERQCEDCIGVASDLDSALEIMDAYLSKHRKKIEAFTGYENPQFVFSDNCAKGMFSDNLVAVSRSQNCNFFVKEFEVL